MLTQADTQFAITLLREFHEAGYTDKEIDTIVNSGVLASQRERLKLAALDAQRDEQRQRDRTAWKRCLTAIAKECSLSSDRIVVVEIWNSAANDWTAVVYSASVPFSKIARQRIEREVIPRMLRCKYASAGVSRQIVQPGQDVGTRVSWFEEEDK